MGKKFSKINCMRTDEDGRKMKRSKSNRIKKTQDMIYVDQSGRRIEDGSTRPTDQDACLRNDSLAASNTAARNNDDSAKLDTILECDETSTKTTAAEDRDEKKVNRIALFAPDTSKKIGNSIEVLPCPDISAITNVTERRVREQSEQPSKQITPNVSPDEELTAVTPLERTNYGDVSAIEISRSTLEVPPNSVNSQFISGIAPMDSLLEVEFIPDTTRDSVFANDLSYVPEHYLDAMYYANFGAGRVLLNNNSLILYQESVKSDARTTQMRTSAELSCGPGLDSDFGASAGVEMRIVSSDFSGGANNTASAVTDPASTGQKTLGVPCAVSRPLVSSDSQPSKSRTNVARRIITGTMPIMQMIPAANPVGGLTYAMVVGNRRAATIGGTDDLQATLEWDPYDVQYDRSHWQEYFIPGVTFPPQPVLCPKEYWL